MFRLQLGGEHGAQVPGWLILLVILGWVLLEFAVALYVVVRAVNAA